MVQATSFLLRWLFLCRLVDDRAEVQTWPYRPPGYYEHQPPAHHPHPQQQGQEGQQGQQGQQYPHEPNAPPHESQHPQRQNHSQRPPPPGSALDDDDLDMPAYRESVIRLLTSYPPGSSERLQRLEELRLETVRQFARRLAHADEVIGWGAAGGSDADAGDFDAQEEDELFQNEDGMRGAAHDIYYDDPFDVDDSIQVDIQQFMQQEHAPVMHQLKKHSNLWRKWHLLRSHDCDENVHAPPDSALPSRLRNPLRSLSPEIAYSSARNFLAQSRDVLSQLVSAVLHSPPSPLPEAPSLPLDDPISSLRSLLIQRCRATPSLGIELCWLLEAEVGRKWKALFEHRQQTGKRLILIVQADIAAAIATIGAEKASAFNLLQDAEMATAFGAERDRPREGGGMTDALGNVRPASTGGEDASPTPPRSISDLRCRHFGDSMHFVDRLTQISLDLRHVPPVHRNSHLQLRLAELNRRLCRRMATRGRISIDVDDTTLHDSHGQQYGHESMSRWSDEEVREDMIPHSVHFPMEPQCERWPGGGSAGPSPSTQRLQQQPQQGTTAAAPEIPDFKRPQGRTSIVRALRILPGECRLLDSAARCPFLVRMEVAETGLDADDARLYAGDAWGVGLSIGEVLGTVSGGSFGHHGEMMGCSDGFAPCKVPLELMGRRQRGRYLGADSAVSGDGVTSREKPGRIHVEGLSRYEPAVTGGDGASDYSTSSSSSRGIPVTPHEGRDAITSTAAENNQAVLSRGGYQGEGEGYYGSSPDMHGRIGMVREQHYEELHHDLHQREKEFNFLDPSMAAARTNQISTGAALLDKVFGQPWNTNCELIRGRSPYRRVPGWGLASFIIKAGEDIRKEALVMQIMSKLRTWFQEEIPPGKRPFLRPYTIMCVGGDAGIVECLPDVKSVNEVKKSVDGFTNLKNFFERAYGPPMPPPHPLEHLQPPHPQQHQQSSTVAPNSNGIVSFEKARDNFLRSLVGYSVLCYILQIKDRHNANILMDRDGHIMHIDFGFVLGETPKMGKVPLFSERAPFKLSAEFWEVIGGWSAFRRFCTMFEAAYAVAAAHSDEICSLVEAAIMNVSRDANTARRMAEGVRGRIQMKGNPKEQKMHIMEIVNDAITSWGTSTYDWLQRSMHGYQ